MGAMDVLLAGAVPSAPIRAPGAGGDESGGTSLLRPQKKAKQASPMLP